MFMVPTTTSSPGSAFSSVICPSMGATIVVRRRSSFARSMSASAASSEASMTESPSRAAEICAEGRLLHFAVGFDPGDGVAVGRGEQSHAVLRPAGVQREAKQVMRHSSRSAVRICAYHARLDAVHRPAVQPIHWR